MTHALSSPIRGRFLRLAAHDVPNWRYQHASKRRHIVSMNRELSSKPYLLVMLLTSHETYLPKCYDFLIFFPVLQLACCERR